MTNNDAFRNLRDVHFPPLLLLGRNSSLNNMECVDDSGNFCHCFVKLVPDTNPFPHISQELNLLMDFYRVHSSSKVCYVFNLFSYDHFDSLFH